MLFMLKKIIALIVLPPGLLVLILASTGCWAMAKKQRLIGLWVLFACALLWLLSIGPTADFLKGGLEEEFTPGATNKADVILMLGGGLYDRSADFSGNGAPGPETMERLVTAARLHRKYHIPIIVSGGRVTQSTNQSIAAVAKRFLVDLGVSPDAVITEENSRDTYENAVYCKRICTTRGYSHPLLVTSGYHLKRALFSFRTVELAVTPYPCALSTWPGKPVRLLNFLPSAGALQATTQALHERLGLLYYWIVY